MVFVATIRQKSRDFSLFGKKNAANAPKSKPSGNTINFWVCLAAVARLTGLEPATPGVTGRYSNHLSYNRPLLNRSRSA